MSFKDDMEKFAVKTIEKMVKVKRQASFDLFSAVVLSTPVDKGVLRNNWFVSHGSPSNTTTEAEAGPQAVISRMQAELAKTTSVDDIYLTNNLPYAVPIEFDGHSAQAPGGMVRINTIRWDTIVSLRAKRLVNE